MKTREKVIFLFELFTTLPVVKSRMADKRYCEVLGKLSGAIYDLKRETEKQEINQEIIELKNSLELLRMANSQLQENNDKVRRGLIYYGYKLNWKHADGMDKNIARKALEL